MLAPRPAGNDAENTHTINLHWSPSMIAEEEDREMITIAVTKSKAFSAKSCILYRDLSYGKYMQLLVLVLITTAYTPYKLLHTVVIVLSTASHES
jgi:hypothetical protein